MKRLHSATTPDREDSGWVNLNYSYPILSFTYSRVVACNPFHALKTVNEQSVDSLPFTRGGDS